MPRINQAGAAGGAGGSAAAFNLKAVSVGVPRGSDSLCASPGEGGIVLDWLRRVFPATVASHPRFFDEQLGSTVGAIDYVRDSGN